MFLLLFFQALIFVFINLNSVNMLRWSSSLRNGRHLLNLRNHNSFLSPQSRNIFRSFSVVVNDDEGSLVELTSGEKGKIVKKKNGWYTIDVDNKLGDDKLIKVRKSAIQSILDTNSSLQQKPQINEILEPIKTQEPKQEKEKNHFIPTINPPLLHTKFEKWIIFSDLHVKSASIETCEKVLDQVNIVAKRENAGIIFLGDFWHVRGSLNVETLNRVLKCLNKWDQPVIMIPGNHDQVTLGGSVHSLEPLRYAFSPEQILMIDKPCICMNALWLPYRRDSGLMRSILAQAGSDPEIQAIFCHAEVKGAFMNDNMRSRDGLDISLFPQDLPIYSGHFHKPHTMTKNGASLRYVGSPYQTSLSEAGQTKFLYCLTCPSTTLSESNGNRKLWKEKERWPIEVGKKYIKAISLEDINISKAQKGDHVVLPVTALPVDREKAEKLRSELELQGVEVELRHERNPLQTLRNSTNPFLTPENTGLNPENSTENQIKTLYPDEVDPLRLFSIYLEHIAPEKPVENPNKTQLPDFNSTDVLGVNSTAAGFLSSEEEKRWDLHEQVGREGRVLLEKLLGSSLGDENSAGISNSRSSRSFNLQLDQVTLSNFGPYGGPSPTRYPLARRGLVLIRGQSTDGTGADSNGSGKTTLAMSVMWGLSGSLDLRLVADGKAQDVTFDVASNGETKSSKRTAEVIVDGFVNQKPFRVLRRRGLKKSELRFWLNDEELTQQAVKDTQMVIDESLGIGNGLLQRCGFFGQHSHTLQSLLGLTDVKLKSELSALVDTALWAKAAQEARLNHKNLTKRNEEVSVETRIRLEEKNRNLIWLDEATKNMQLLENQLVEVKFNMSSQKNESDFKLNEFLGNFTITELEEKQQNLEKQIENYIKNEFEPLKTQQLVLLKNQNSETEIIDKRINNLREEQVKLNSTYHSNDQEKKKIEGKLKGLNLKRRVLNDSMTSMFAELRAPLTSEITEKLENSNEFKEQLELTNEKDFFDSEILHKIYVKSQAEVAKINAKLVNFNKSMEALLSSEKSIQEHSHPTGLSRDLCPTCAQDMPAGSRDLRKRELMESLNATKSELNIWNKLTMERKKRQEIGFKLKSALEQDGTLRELEEEAISEIKKLQDEAKLTTELLSNIQKSGNNLVQEKQGILSKWSKNQEELALKISEMEKELQYFRKEEQMIKHRISEGRKTENTLNQEKQKIDSTLAMLTDRVNLANTTIIERKNILQNLEEIILNLEKESGLITKKTVVLDRLVAILGPKGIQNFVFQGVIRQLEDISNGFLTVLAEGGIQLALQQGEINGSETVITDDRIIKSVFVRSRSDGEFRERALSQLSGGQWRRVSMSLDLAFAEVIRRRGILKTNLLVMDEVLTHLDATGREAVGSVLRAMVRPPSVGAGATTTSMESFPQVIDEEKTKKPEKTNKLTDSTKDESKQIMENLFGGGAYETIIVILQDLVAAELEESFDHVDMVFKESDIATVEVENDFA